MKKKVVVSIVLMAMVFAGLGAGAAVDSRKLQDLLGDKVSAISEDKAKQLEEVQEKYADKKIELARIQNALEAIYDDRKAEDSFKDQVDREKAIIEIREAYSDKKSELNRLAEEIEAIYGDKGIGITEMACNIYNDCETTTDPVTPSPKIVSFKSDTDLSRIHRVIALFETSLQEAILGGVNDATVEGLIEKVANIYLVSFDDNGSYPGIVGEIYETMSDFQQVDSTGTPLPLEQDALRQLLYMARVVLAEMPRMQGDTVVNGNLAVTGDTRLHNVGIDGSLIVDGEVVAKNIEGDYIHAVDLNIQASVETASLKAKEASLKLSHIRQADIEAAKIDELRSEIISTSTIEASGANLESAVINSLEASGLRARSINTGNLAVDGTIGADQIEANSIGATSIKASIIDVQDEFSANSAKIEGSLAVGLYSTVKDANSNSVALGYGNEVAGQNSFAIGTGLTNNVSDTIVMGFDSAAMTIVKAQPNLDNEDLIDLRKRMLLLNGNIKRYNDLLNMPQYRRWYSYIKNQIVQWQEEISDKAQEYDRILASLHADTKPKVGFGISELTRSVHISGAMKLEPSYTPPADPSMGDIYVNVTGALCVFLGEDWEVAAGSGSCYEVSTANSRGGGAPSRVSGGGARRY